MCSKAIIVSAATGTLFLLGLGGCRAARPTTPPLAVVQAAESQRRPLNLEDPLERAAAGNPLAFLRDCRDRYLTSVRDYTCRFRMCERVDDARPEMGPVQIIDIRFRETPYSVDMRWVRNALQATRVNFVKGRWRRGERELALIVPAGLLSLLAPTGVKLDICSPEVRAAHARGIDDFGFRRTLESIIARCEKAADESEYRLRAVGAATFDGRECIVLERRLPYTGPGGTYPDRLFVMYIDRQWRVPLACYAYADDERAGLIGSYEAMDVRFNVGLSDDDF